MSRIPRTPVHFPRMKVRGRRNKAKLAARHETRYSFPAATLVSRGKDGRVTFAAGNPIGVTTHRIELSQWRDGYDRPVAAPPPKPKPKPTLQTWSMGVTFSQSEDQRAAFRDLFDTMTGEKR